MDPIAVAWFGGGLVALVAGAELLVRGASRLAAIAGVSPLVIGLTVVACGTSTPELAVSIRAGLAGRSDIAVGNVVGSNIFNVLAILGASAAIAPLVVRAQVVRREVPLLIGACLLALALAWDGRIGRGDGVVLTAGIVAYTGFTVAASRRESAAVRAEFARAFGGAPAPSRGARAVAAQIALLAAGLLLLGIGARGLVAGAVAAARALAVSDLVIGLTVVAVGTSLPEVATSLVAAMRGERDIAVGNVIGSSLYNVLAILGLASLVTPGGLQVAPAVRHFDLPAMTAVAFACAPVVFTGHRIDRWKGWLFLGYYAAYSTYLVLAAVAHDTLRTYVAVMLGFVLPVTLLTLVVVTLRELRARRAGRTP